MGRRALQVQPRRRARRYGIVVVEAPHSTASLVSKRRFGAALAAARVAEGASLSALARRCDGWWLPDELAGFEQGVAELDDAEVLSIARLYHLKGRPIAAPGAAELVLDRSTAPEVNIDGVTEPIDDPVEVTTRLWSLTSLLGIDVDALRAHTVLAEGLASTTSEVDAALRHSRGAVDQTVVEAVGGRMVVPVTGILVAFTPGGSIMLTRPSGRWGRSSHSIPGAAPLRSLVAGRADRAQHHSPV